MVYVIVNDKVIPIENADDAKHASREASKAGMQEVALYCERWNHNRSVKYKTFRVGENVKDTLHM